MNDFNQPQLIRELNACDRRYAPLVDADRDHKRDSATRCWIGAGSIPTRVLT